MDHKAALLALILVSSSLAGCTGDPDAGGGDEFDADALQNLIDQNLQDFINNTSVTVYQEIHHHYHNNTTIDNTDNSVSNVNGSGAGSGSIMQMLTVNWNHADDIQIIDHGSRIVTLNDTLQQTSGEPSLLYALVYNGNLIEFRDVNCEQSFNYAALNDNAWESYLYQTYGNSNDLEGVASGLEIFWYNIMHSNYRVNAAGESVREQCGFYSYYDYHYPTVFQIQLSVGQALDFMSLPELADITLECDDGYSGSSSNGSVGSYLGGQADCTVSGIAQVRSNHEYDNYYFIGTGGNNSTSSTGYDLSNIPDWWMRSTWYFFEQYSTQSSTPLEFAVYFTTYFVEVYDLDSE